MATPLKIGGFVAILAVVFVLAIGIGQVAGPTDAAAQPADAQKGGGDAAGRTHGPEGMPPDGSDGALEDVSLPAGSWCRTPGTRLTSPRPLCPR